MVDIGQEAERYGSDEIESGRYSCKRKGGKDWTGTNNEV